MNKAIEKIYEALDLDLNEVESDIEGWVLTDMTARSGRKVWWYLDGRHEMAVYDDTCEELSKEQVEAELL